MHLQINGKIEQRQEEIWARDAEALEWAIGQLGGEEAGEG